MESLHEPLSLRKLKETHLAPGPPLTLVKISGASQRPFETCHQSLAVDLQGLPTLRHVEVPVWSGLVWSAENLHQYLLVEGRVAHLPQGHSSWP